MIIRISGGIGNQMFQYAMKKKMDTISGKENYIDVRFYSKNNVHNGYELEKIFGIDDIHYSGKIKAPSELNPILYKILYKLKKRILKTNRYLMEILITFYPKYGELSGDEFYLDGYWQSEEYFADIQDTIRKCFVFQDFTEKENIELMKILFSEETVAIHVRRGDFLEASKFVCLCSTDYYSKAIDYIKKKIKNPVFIILSDDIEWCRNNLELDDTAIYVDWNTGDRSFRDMQIMSVCKHNIIANSSFSWWGAWLNKNPNKLVVSPYKFYVGEDRDESHLIPERWKKIRYNEEK